MLTTDIAVSKVAKYATRESGDSVEMIERPRGGISMVMADGQRSGHAAKVVSNLAVRKAASLLAEGVRDGPAARAAHDYLRTERRGQVSAELVIVSIDLESRTLVISRNSHCPVLYCQDNDWQALDEPSEVVGIYRSTRPVITELPLSAGQVIIAFSDGLQHAGRRRGQAMDVLAHAQRLACLPGCTARDIAEGLLATALELDENRPGDDITIMVFRVVDAGEVRGPEVRRMSVSFPVPPI